MRVRIYKLKTSNLSLESIPVGRIHTLLVSVQVFLQQMNVCSDFQFFQLILIKGVFYILNYI